MVNFVCQLDWDTGYPDIWSTIILDVSMRVFVNLTFKSIDWVKQIALPNMGEPWQSVEAMNRSKGWPPPNLTKRKFLLPNCLRLVTEVFILPLDILPKWNFDSFWILILPAFGMELYHKLSWFSGLQTLTGTIHWLPLVPLSLYLSVWRIQDIFWYWDWF